MKKVGLVLALALIAGQVFGDEWNAYSSEYKGYKGNAFAEFNGDNYVDTLAKSDNPFAILSAYDDSFLLELKEDLIEKFKAAGYELVPKLTAEQHWVAEQALGEYALEHGDIFTVGVYTDDMEGKYFINMTAFVGIIGELEDYVAAKAYFDEE